MNNSRRNQNIDLNYTSNSGKQVQRLLLRRLDNDFSFGGNVSVSGSAVVSGSLTIYGSSVLSGNLNLTGSSFLKGNMSIGTLSVPPSSVQLNVSGGNIGIMHDTTSDNNQPKLIFYGANAARRSSIQFYDGTGDKGLFLVSDTDPIRFYVSGSTRMSIFSGGNVSIGIPEPATPLHVSGNIRMKDDTVTLQFADNTGTVNAAIQCVSGSGLYIIQQQSRSIYTRIGASILTTLTNDGRLGIGADPPNASAQLDVASTTRGLLVPRMNTTQRDAISSPAQGLIVYNTTVNKFQGYNGGWVDFH